MENKTNDPADPLWLIRTGGRVGLSPENGKCTIVAKGEQISLSQFDRVPVPRGLEELEIIADNIVVLLEYQPPRPQSQASRSDSTAVR